MILFIKNPKFAKKEDLDRVEVRLNHAIVVGIFVLLGLVTATLTVALK